MSANAPLAGIKVLDFSTLLPGPYATMLMADMGAEVLRIESTSRPDLLRMLPPMDGASSYAHRMINRNKRSLAVDLSQPEARRIIHQLLKDYDVLIEQFRPGVMQRFSLDYAALQDTYPRLIYCSLTGYGQTGPLSHKAGHDINYLALSGLASYGGNRTSGPVLSATQIADLAGGAHHSVMAILAAVIARNSSQQGQYLDISMCDTAFSLNTMFGAASLATGKDPMPGEEVLNGGGLYDYYETADGRYLAVGSLEPQFARALFDALEHPQWQADYKFPTIPDGAFKHQLRQLFIARPLSEWLEVFKDIDACVEPVLSVTEAAQHAHFKHRRMICEVRLANDKSVKQIAPPVKFKGCVNTMVAGKELGEDTKAVLQSLGYDTQQIDQLVADEIVVIN